MDDKKEPVGRRGTERVTPPREPFDDDPHAYDDPPNAGLGPASEEVDEWADTERRRREAWVAGPSDAERRAWARREQRRRQRQSTFAATSSDRDSMEFDPLEERFRREAQLLVEGAMASFWRLPFRLLAETTRTGRMWEADQDMRSRRRRVPFVADDF
jgi:hypothetical protein